jgi:hypothetical protein
MEKLNDKMLKIYDNSRLPFMGISFRGFIYLSYKLALDCKLYTKAHNLLSLYNTTD